MERKAADESTMIMIGSDHDAGVAMTKCDNVYDGGHGEADHTEVMRPTDSQVSLNGAAHHQEYGTAESDPGGRKGASKLKRYQNKEMRCYSGYSWNMNKAFPPESAPWLTCRMGSGSVGRCG